LVFVFVKEVSSYGYEKKTAPEEDEQTQKKEVASQAPASKEDTLVESSQNSKVKR